MGQQTSVHAPAREHSGRASKPQAGKLLVYGATPQTGKQSLIEGLRTTEGLTRINTRPIGSNCPAPIKAEPHLLRRRREDAQWQDTQIEGREPNQQDEQQVGDRDASRLVSAVMLVGILILFGLACWASYWLEVLHDQY